MANDIKHKQNQENSINMIAAFRQMYSDVKRLSLVQVVLSVWVPVVLVLAIISLKSSSITSMLGFGSIDISLYVSFYCAVIALADLFLLTNLIEARKELAAKIQEQFDTNVLGLAWNYTLVGYKPDAEDIYRLRRKFFKSSGNKKKDLINWYNPKVSKVLHKKGILLCQRMNLFWDKSLREAVNERVFRALLFWCAFIFGIALYQDLSLTTLLLTVICPLLPIISYTIKMIKDNKASIVILSRLKNLLETAWDDADSELLDIGKLREVQNEIYQHRKTNRPISNRFYWKRKGEYEDNAQYSIEQMIADLDGQRKTVQKAQL